jgi:multiple sugar transport system permease protein
MSLEMSNRPSTLRRQHGAPLLGLRARHLIKQIIVYALLLILSAAFLLPFLWMVATSLKKAQDVFTYPPSFFPNSFEWRNYITGWTILPFTTFLKNSLIVTTANVIGNLVSCSLVAFGFARLRGRGRDLLFLLLLATIMIPREVTIVPRFLLFQRAGLVNTLWPLILPAWFGYPFFIFLLRQFFMSIPHELDEAARIDGASSFRILTTIILPLAKPALATVAVLEFIAAWKSFLEPLIYLSNQNNFTVALGLTLFRSGFGGQVQWGPLMAATALSALPPLIVCFAMQNHLVGGIAGTGLKG